MGRKCGICYHHDREAIEKALREKVSLRAIAGRYGTTRSALQRHAAHIIAEAAVDAPPVVLPETKPATFVEEMDRLKATALKWLALTEAAENSAAAVTWHRALRETLELYFKIGVEQMKAAAEAASPTVPTAETSDADWLRFIDTDEAETCFPGLRETYADFQTRRLIVEHESGKAEQYKEVGGNGRRVPAGISVELRNDSSDDDAVVDGGILR